jgi:hypothetical protein
MVKTPFAMAVRKKFTMTSTRTLRIHVTADERYELFLDGQFIGRGSERGDQENWFFETYDLDLKAGDHVLVAKIWALGNVAPYAQFSVKPGFLLSAEGEFLETLGTGIAAWEYKMIEGLEFYREGMVWGTGADMIVHGDKYPWGFEKGEGNDWKPAIVIGNARDAKFSNEVGLTQRLRPATLPARLDLEVPHAKVRFLGKVDSFDLKSVAIHSQDHVSDEAGNWNMIGTKQTITIPPKTGRRVILDLENYYCAYPIVTTQGGKDSQVRLFWAEALFLKPGEYEPKGNRNEIEGKFFVGAGDTFFPDGGARTFTTLWWQAGRYLELVVQTADEPLTLGLELRETRYPLVMENSFEASDKRLNDVIPIALRGLQMCSHETYMDCPYYEQLMYVGDTRLEALTTYMITHDDRLPRKALDLFRASLIHSGLTQSRYPSRERQVIPPFSLLWVGMVYDFAMWRGDREFVQEMMPGVRGVIDAFLTFQNADGLIQGPNGWNFMDWVPSWYAGIPPEGDSGVSGVINWLMVYTLKRAAEVEEWIGELELAQRDNRLAEDLATRIMGQFWDEKKNLFADDPAHKFFSEHSQCLAILSGVLDETITQKIGKSLLNDPDLARTTIYFSHYLFETCQQLGRIDALFDRLSLWFELERNGFKTTFESPEPSRSDCHAWGAHPIFHYYSSILGIRPAEMGFDKIVIKPQLGPLEKVKATLVHPRGKIEVDFQQKNGNVFGTLTLPEGVSGVFVQHGKATPIKSGRQNIE